MSGDVRGRSMETPRAEKTSRGGGTGDARWRARAPSRGGEARDADAVEKARAAAAAAIAHEGEGVEEDERRRRDRRRPAATRRRAGRASRGDAHRKVRTTTRTGPDEISAKARHLSAARANYDFSIITCPRNRQKRLDPPRRGTTRRRAVRGVDAVPARLERSDAPSKSTPSPSSARAGLFQVRTARRHRSVRAVNNDRIAIRSERRHDDRWNHPGPADKTKGETKGKTKVRLGRQVRATPPDPARSRLSPRAAASPAASRALRSSRPFRDGRGDLSPTQPPSRFPDRPGSHLPLDHRPSPQTMPASTVRATSICGASLSRTMRSPLALRARRPRVERFRRGRVARGPPRGSLLATRTATSRHVQHPRVHLRGAHA